MRLADFNWFDWVLVAVTIFSMAMAFRRGLVRAICGLFGFVAGFLAAAASDARGFTMQRAFLLSISALALTWASGAGAYTMGAGTVNFAFSGTRN